MDDLSRTALIVVDMQKTFGAGGELPVPLAEEVGTRITDWMNETNYGLIVASCEDHIRTPNLNDGHFAETPEQVDFEQGVWPPHGMRGTRGAEFIETIDVDMLDEIVFKGHGTPAASAFEGLNSSGESLDQILLSGGIQDIHVVGVATDVCVKATAQAGNDLDFKTTIIWDLTAAVRGTESRQMTCLALSAEGILSRSSDDLRAALGLSTSTEGANVS